MCVSYWGGSVVGCWRGRVAGEYYGGVCSRLGEATLEGDVMECRVVEGDCAGIFGCPRGGGLWWRCKG